MAQPIYEFNPYNDNPANLVTETFVMSGGRTVYYPRATPFFGADVKVFKNAVVNPDGTVTGTLLNLGNQVGLTNQFGEMITKYKQNTFGGVALPLAGSETYVIQYSTLGGPFILDEASYAELVANQLAADPTAYWEDLDFTTVPTEWPPAPHPEPINLVYNVQDLFFALRDLILVKNGDTNFDLYTAIVSHIAKPLNLAHQADAEMVQLGQTPNMRAANRTDLNGNPPSCLVTMDVLKEAFRLYDRGELNL